MLGRYLPGTFTFLETEIISEIEYQRNREWNKFRSNKSPEAIHIHSEFLKDLRMAVLLTKYAFSFKSNVVPEDLKVMHVMPGKLFVMVINTTKTTGKTRYDWIQPIWFPKSKTIKQTNQPTVLP